MPAIMETWLVRQLHLLGGDHEAFVVSGGPIRLNHSRLSRVLTSLDRCMG